MVISVPIVVSKEIYISKGTRNSHPLERRNIGDLGSSGGHGTAQLGDSKSADLGAVVVVGPQINAREGVVGGNRRRRGDRASTTSGSSLGGCGTDNGARGRRVCGSRLALGVEVVDLDTLVSTGAARSTAPVLTTTLRPMGM